MKKLRGELDFISFNFKSFSLAFKSDLPGFWGFGVLGFWGLIKKSSN